MKTNTNFKFFTSLGEYKEDYLITRMNAVESATIFFGMPTHLNECSMFEILRVKDNTLFTVYFNEYNKGDIIVRDTDENISERKFENEEEFNEILGIENSLD